jgi:hypothetical protein
MPRAEATRKTLKAWVHTHERRRAFVMLGHQTLPLVERAQTRRRAAPVGPCRESLWIGWEVYAASLVDEFSGGHTHEERDEFDDMLRLAGRL